MATFNDTKDTTWGIDLTVGSLSRVKKQMGIDLLRLDDEQTLKRLMYDPMALAGVLWVLLEEQARGRDLDEEGFAGRLDGDTIVSATDAMLEAIADFSRPAQRPVLKRAIQRMQEAETEAGRLAMQAVNDAPMHGS